MTAITALSLSWCAACLPRGAGPGARYNPMSGFGGRSFELIVEMRVVLSTFAVVALALLVLMLL
jgi:hypothetical protein